MPEAGCNQVLLIFKNNFSCPTIPVEIKWAPEIINGPLDLAPLNPGLHVSDFINNDMARNAVKHKEREFYLFKVTTNKQKLVTRY